MILFRESSLDLLSLQTLFAASALRELLLTCRDPQLPCSSRTSWCYQLAHGHALHAPDTPSCARAAGTPAARSAVAGLGAGVGIGMGYTDCKHEFDLVDKAAEAK